MAPRKRLFAVSTELLIQTTIQDIHRLLYKHLKSVIIEIKYFYYYFISIDLTYALLRFLAPYNFIHI